MHYSAGRGEVGRGGPRAGPHLESPNKPPMAPHESFAPARFSALWPDYSQGRFGNEERKSVQMKTRIGLRQRSLCSSGQSIVEFAIILPLVLVLVLGVVEFSYELLDLHVVTKLTREGSNLMSR